MDKNTKIDEADVLKRAIEKAAENGFDIKDDICLSQDTGWTLLDWTEKPFEQYSTLRNSKGLFSFLFDPSFAKAFWKNEDTEGGNMYYREEDRQHDYTEAWQLHQHAMLDEVQGGKSAVAYLATFL